MVILNIDIRARERFYLEMSAYVQSASVALTPVIPILAVIVTFLIHIEFGYDLSPIEVHTRKELNQDMLHVILSIVFSSRHSRLYL